MQLLTPSFARHFCASFSSHTATQTCNVKEYLKRPGNRSMNILAEGSPKYAELRDCILREAERMLFLSSALCGSALAANRSASSAWTLVTLYYSAFLAAQGLLAMHGGYMVDRKLWVECKTAQGGGLTLNISRTLHPQLVHLSGSSSHKAFWTLFYYAVRSLYTHAPNQLAFALTPIQSSDTWLIDTRNKFNYQMPAAIQLFQDFELGYSGQSLPQSMPSQLVTVDNTAQALRELAADWRAAYGLRSDIVSATYPTLQDAVNALIKTARDAALDAFSGVKLQALRV